MRHIRILGRNFRDSFRSIFRNFSLSLASISCITITLLVVSISMVLSYNVNNFTTEIERDVTIVVFLDSEVEEEEIKVIESKIKQMVEVESVDFKGKQEIAQEMMDSSETYTSIMAEWNKEDNPLQDTYLVKVKDINTIENVANSIKEIEGVSVVKYGEGMIEQLIVIFNTIKNVTIAIVVALIIVTAFLISNTIKITIGSRKREIEIMRLVGSSNINIKIPFMLEGLFLGIIGSIIPILATCYGYMTLYTKLDGQLFTAIFQLLVPSPFIYQISVVLLGIGMLVGMFGSYRAVKKYLKI